MEAKLIHGKLPVWRTAWAAVRSPFEQWSDFVRLATIPFLIMLAAGIVTAFFAWILDGSTNSALRGIHGLIVLIDGLAGIVAYTSLHVAWIRLLVLGAEDPRTRLPFAFGWLETRFLLIPFGLGLALFSPAILMIVISIASASTVAKVLAIPLAIVTGVAAMWAMVRFSLLAPAIAVERFASLRAIWIPTEGFCWRIVGIFALAVLPISLIAGIFGGIAKVSHSEFLIRVFAWGAMMAIQTATIGITAAAAAMIYRALVPTEPAAAAA